MGGNLISSNPTSTHQLPQDPTKLFRSLSHEDSDGDDDDNDEGNKEGSGSDDEIHGAAGEEGRFIELPSTSHRSPLTSQYYSSSIERKLERINERVDKILKESEKNIR